MARSYADPLALSQRVLRALITLNLLAGVLILGLLVASLVAEAPVMQALGAGPPDGNARLYLGMRLIAVIGIAAVPVLHLILTQLLAIVVTVGAGDPFAMPNATRLQHIAWAVLGLELLHLVVGAIAASVSTATAPLRISWGLSVTRWIVVLMLFVLARVFEQGARMRDELTGTI